MMPPPKPKGPTMKFRIHSISSGENLGLFDGATPAEAAREMRMYAGYATDEAAAEALGVAVEDLDDDLSITEAKPATVRSAPKVVRAPVMRRNVEDDDLVLAMSWDD